MVNTRSYFGAFTMMAALALMLTLPSLVSAAPGNDNFADAQPVSGESASVNGTNSGATTEIDEPSPVPSSASVWYRWTAPKAGPVAMDTCTSDFDTVLGVYVGNAVGSLTQVAANDDSCGLGSDLTFGGTAGTTYHIRVAGYGSSQGNFTLDLKLVEPPPTSTASATTASGATYTSNTWTREDVRVSLSARDEEGGSGVKELTYSATGAQPIASTTVPANELPKRLPIIKTEGTTTISFFATDNAGNRESPAKTFTVKIDKSAPTLDTDNSDGADGITPDNGAMGIGRSVSPRATFSDEMDPNSLRASTKFHQWNTSKKEWQRVPTAVSVEGDTATLDPYPTEPGRLLAANKEFKVTITTGAKNVVGLPMSRNKSWTFTTGAVAYSAVDDFSATQNPSGTWSYGYRESAWSDFVLYPSHANPWGPSFDQWSLYDSPTVTPHVTHNRTGDTASYSSITQPSDVLNLHPGPSGERSEVRWTAPSSGTVTIEGRFEGIDTVGTTTDVAVVHNSATTLFDGSINGYGATATAPFSITQAVAAGDTIDFSVGYGSNADHAFDSTGLSATFAY